MNALSSLQTSKRPTPVRPVSRKPPGQEWQETSVELIRSLMENMITTRSIEMKKKCMQSIENEVSKLAYDSAILQRERKRYDEVSDSTQNAIERYDKDNRALRLQVEELQQRNLYQESKARELQDRLIEAERNVQRLSVEEGCRERLVQALRQIEEESQAKMIAEQQVRGQMDRLQALTADRDELLHSLDREKAEKSAAQTALSEATEKNYEYMRTLANAEHAKNCLQVKVSQLEENLDSLRNKYQLVQRYKDEVENFAEKELKLQNRINRLDEALEKEREHSKSLQNLNSDLEKEIERFKSRLHTLIEEHEQEKISNSSNLEANDRAFAKLKQELSENQSKLLDADAKIVELKEILKQKESMIQELNEQKDQSYKRLEEIQRKVVDMEASFNQREAELLSSKQSLEEDYRKLEEQNSLSSMQFQKLCEESTRLLSACENEKDLRTKLEAALHIKERQVSSLMEMNARLSADLYVSNLKGPGLPALRENVTTSVDTARGASDFEGAMDSRMQPNAWQKKEDSPRRFEQTAAHSNAYHAGLTSPMQDFPPKPKDEMSSMLYTGGDKRVLQANASSTLNASAQGEMSLDRKRLMEEIESLISSLQTRSN